MTPDTLAIAAVLLLLYPYLFYPVLLSLWVWPIRAKRNRGTNLPEPQEEYPAAVMVICALNEEKIIGQKMENCLALKYSVGKLRILVVSDGSTDCTAAIVRGYAKDGIELIERPERRGKIANLNDVLPGLREEIIVLSDANVIYRQDAVMKLVRRFEDPAVGCVSGKVFLTDSAPALDGPTGNYYSFEWSLQDKSSQVYSMVGADGAMYAIRRDLFQPCPADTLIEDFVIPMRVIGAGKRVVHEPEAVGWEKGPETLREEFRRKVRIAAGCAQGLLRGSAWPPVNAPLRFWFIFVSHKLLRWLSPVLGIAVLCLSAFSGERFSSEVLLSGFMAVIGLALVRTISGWTHPLVSAPFYFLFGQVALAIGLLKGMLGIQSVLWGKADR